jgi:hypothetical protein
MMNLRFSPLLLAAMLVLLSTPVAWSQATLPRAPGRPGPISEPVPPSQKVRDYFAVAKRDAERAEHKLAGQSALPAHLAGRLSTNEQHDLRSGIHARRTVYKKYSTPKIYYLW